MTIARTLANRRPSFTLSLGVLLALSVGCGGSGGSGAGSGSNGAYFKIESEGAGTENAAPLDSLLVGTRRLELAGEDAVITGETRGEHGERIIRYESRRNLAWVIDDDDGFFAAGTGSNGPNGAPVLYAPRTVRVGMRWVTFDEKGNKAFTFNVKSRDVEDTIFGEGIVWRIEQTSQLDPVPAIRAYAEGIGLFSIGNIYNPVNYHSGFLPTKTTITKTPGPAQPLEPFTVDGKQAQWPEFEATWITSIDDDGSQTIGLSGHTIVHIIDQNGENWINFYAGRCSTFKNDQIVDTEFTPPSQASPYTKTAGAACLGMGNPPNTLGVAPQWSDATGAIVNPDHSVDWIARNNGYTTMNQFFPGTAWFANYLLDGKAFNTLYYYDAVHTYARNWGETDLLDQSTAFEGADGLVGLNALQQLESTRDNVRVLTSPLRNAGKSTPVAMISQTGLVSHTLSENGFTPPVPQLALNGGLSVRATGNLREALSVSYDGDISRVVLAESGVHLERLAHVAVEKGQKLAGALRTSGDYEPALGDRLLVFTYSGKTVPGGPTEDDVVGPTLAWTAQVTELTDLSKDDQVPALAVSAVASGFDVVVCYPPSDERLETEGWTLGGAPAKRVVATGPSDSCALIVRDHLASEPLAPGRFFVEGPVPGVGVMRISLPAELGPFGLPSAELPHAALKGGGLASHWQIYGPGGVALAGARSTLGFPFKGLPDRQGNGLWLQNCSTQAPVCARTLVGRETSHFDVAERWGLLGVVGGGGAFFTRAEAPELLSVDGTLTPLVDGLGTPFVPWGIADGVACRVDPAGVNMECLKDGVTTATPIPTADAPGGAVAGNYGMFSLEDGSFLCPNPVDGTWRFDPATQTYEQSSTRNFRLSAYGADGSFWALLDPAVETGQVPGPVDVNSLVRFTPEGPQPFDAGLPPTFFAESPLVNFAVDEQVLLLFRKDGAVVRVARD